MDLEGAGVFTHLNGSAREFFSILAGLAQNYYPERLYKLVVVNAPRAFPMAWNFIRPFLDIHTQNKIFVPSQKDQFKVLSELIDAEFIPKKFGGKCDCEAKGCFTGPNPPNFVDALRYEEGNWQPRAEGKPRLTQELSHADIRAGNMSFDDNQNFDDKDKNTDEKDKNTDEKDDEEKDKTTEKDSADETSEKVKDLSIS